MQRQAHNGPAPLNVAAFGNALLAGWTAACGVSLLDVQSPAAAPVAAMIAFVLALLTARLG